MTLKKYYGKLIHEGPSAFTYIDNDFDIINKVFNADRDYREELRMINIMSKIIPNTWNTKYITDDINLVISLPKLENIYEINDKLVDDITKEVNIINDRGYMHLDISSDNILYDQYNKRYVLIDYGFVMKTEDAIDYVTLHGPESIYKKLYRDPCGFTRNSDIYAVSLLKTNYIYKHS